MKNQCECKEIVNEDSYKILKKIQNQYGHVFCDKCQKEILRIHTNNASYPLSINPFEEIQLAKEEK